MVFVDKNNWFENVFAEVLDTQDIIRQPLENYPELSEKEKDQLRQTEVFKDEVVQVLAEHENFKLIRKFEKTLGWIRSDHLSTNKFKTQFENPTPNLQDALEFLSSWKGTIYVFGGISRQGIDCSGFSQLYYLNVLGMILPKNSNDQRKLGKTVAFDELEDHDLIFCRPYNHPDHHVVIYFKGQFWHSRRSKGVVCQTNEEFLMEFRIEDSRKIFPEAPFKNP